MLLSLIFPNIDSILFLFITAGQRIYTYLFFFFFFFLVVSSKELNDSITQISLSFSKLYKARVYIIAVRKNNVVKNVFKEKIRLLKMCLLLLILIGIPVAIMS